MATSYTDIFSTGDRTSLIEVTSNITFSGSKPPNFLVDGAKPNTYFPSGSVADKYIMFDFKVPVVIDEAMFYTSIASKHGVWRWQGSNDGNVWENIGNEFELSGANLGNALTTLNGNTKRYRFYKLIGISGNFNTSTVVYEIDFKSEIVLYKKTLVYNSGEYKTYKSGVWMTVGVNEPTVDNFISDGIDDISEIPEDVWGQLVGDVEFVYYTEEHDKIEVQFNVQTEPFTLEDIFAGQTIKIIEYTDNPNQAESAVTLETEPFTLYDELGEEVDVLYYTDDPDKTSAELEINAEYSPLDELEGDFEVVTWTDDEESEELNISMDALPMEQLLISPYDFTSYGDLKSIVANKVPDTGGTIKLLFSFDSGNTWESYKYGEWFVVDISKMADVKKHSMSIYDLSKIDKESFENKEDSIRVAYYIDESEHISDTLRIENVRYLSDAPTENAKFSGIAYYLLNTTATINLTFAGNKIVGVLDDVDKGKVQYRVLLNGNPYYPASGQFTRLLDSPHDIKLVIDDRQIKFGVDNTLRVEFMDYWGFVDSWSATFIGTHSGLVFTDEQGNFYTTAFGEVLKYLDFGQIIAGQTTIDHKVLLKNNIGYDVENVSIKAVQPALNGVKIELSKQQSPFIAEDELIYPDILQTGEHVEFAVRITTELTAQETPSGKFEIRVNADRV